MAKYFNYFPKTYYTLSNNNSLDIVTNIITRFSFEESLKNNTFVYYEYEIQEGDTPEIIAHKYYGHVERHWIVLLFNNIIDPEYDWPLTSHNLNKFIDKKYESQGGLSWAMNSNNIHSYYKISTRTSNEYGTSLIEKIQITPGEYANTGIVSNNYVLDDGTSVTETISTETKTYYQYETEINEKKRKIKLLKSEFVNKIEKEFKEKIK